MSGRLSTQGKERMAAITIWLANRSARNKSWLDKLARRLVRKATTPPGEDFMRDPLVDGDQGFDPDELERYQKGEGG